jgi:ABC-type taurine transport system substrate-binding protein
MKYLSTKDHTGRPQLLHAETFEGLVEEMRVTNFLPTDSVAEFMRGIVERCRMWNSAVIRMDTAEHFLTDLEAEGLVTFEVAH